MTNSLNLVTRLHVKPIPFARPRGANVSSGRRNGRITFRAQVPGLTMARTQERRCHAVALSSTHCMSRYLQMEHKHLENDTNGGAGCELY